MNYDTQERNSNGIELNVFAFLKVLAKKIWIIVALAIIFGAAGAGISTIFKHDTYTTNLSFVVNTVSNDNEKIDNSDISASINVASTYKYILEGRSVSDITSKKCTVPVKPSEVRGAMTVNILRNSNVIEVTIKTGSAQKSYAIAIALVENYNDVVTKIYSNANLNICDRPEIPASPDANSNTFVATAVGIMSGAILGFIIIVIYYFLKNTIRSVEDIYRKLGINVLGTVNKVGNKAKGLLITNKKIGFAYIETFKAIRTKVESNSAK